MVKIFAVGNHIRGKVAGVKWQIEVITGIASCNKQRKWTVQWSDGKETEVTCRGIELVGDGEELAQNKKRKREDKEEKKFKINNNNNVDENSSTIRSIIYNSCEEIKSNEERY